METAEDDSRPFVPQLLLRLAEFRMPSGKYARQLLVNLPAPYVTWFANERNPRGEPGKMLRMVHEIKIDGLEHLSDPSGK